MNLFVTPGFIQTLIEAAQDKLSVPRDSTDIIIEFDGSDLDSLTYSVIHYFKADNANTCKTFEFDSIEALIEWTRE